LTTASLLADAMFELLEIKNMEHVDFGEFVLSMMTYALFETSEIRKFCFFMFDKDKNGFIHKDEFILFVEMIHTGDSALANIIKTVDNLDVDDGGKFTWKEFNVLADVYPQVLFPCFRVQISMIRNILGIKWWAAKKDYLLLLKLAEAERDERIKRKQLAMIEKQRQAAIRRDMGFIDYYLRPDLRYQYDMKYPPTTADQLVQMDAASIEDRLNKLVLGGNAETFTNLEEDGEKKDDRSLNTLDENAIVDAYDTLDQNFFEVGQAKREGRRIMVQPLQPISSPSKKKKKKKKKRTVLDHERYKAKIMLISHGKIAPE